MLERMKFGLVVLNESLREMKPEPWKLPSDGRTGSSRSSHKLRKATKSDREEADGRQGRGPVVETVCTMKS